MTEIKHQYKQLGLPQFKSNTGNADRAAILRDNKLMRDGLKPGARNFGESDGFGRVELRIPEFDYPFIRAMFPELKSRCATERQKAWRKFALSPLSEPYRVGLKKRKGGLIVP